jgi:uncharacterized hydrophobic protein (TIGR00271 family)
MPHRGVLFRFIRTLLRIQPDEDVTQTYKEVEEGAYFKGVNIWLLGCSMVLASIGLITNSLTAVIGAMLISPLMGPVIGLGFGMAVYDAKLIRSSLVYWLIAAVVSILSSALYFIISPHYGDTDLLFSFSHATVFDILLAFFGGAAGFLGITRREGVKVLAGVAVATACIPPLCTAGYGLATRTWEHVWGGFYFFFINCIFIGWATFLLARLLQYHRRCTNKKQEIPVWIKTLFLSVVLVTLIPAGWLAWQKFLKQRSRNRILQVSEQVRKDRPQYRIAAVELQGRNEKTVLRFHTDTLMGLDAGLRDTEARIRKEAADSLVIEWVPTNLALKARLEALQTPRQTPE